MHCVAGDGVGIIAGAVLSSVFGITGLAEGSGHRVQQRAADALHRVHPRCHDRPQLGQRRRPQVGAAQAQPRRVARLERREADGLPML